ncbi:prepilin-type N-terminal cleavage/methylation domain-containing protein [Candidatus Daviesbacteria bacterium]|nr:prepilin-type N-terminal cleavage/methylation domain-containing protein [Candidatus Daviesbacteria bacterium]
MACFKKRNGFTLVELLVAVVIITILSVVGFVSFKNVRNQALQAKMKADIDAIRKVYEQKFDPSLNSGQGGYQKLRDTDFASGKIPVQPDGNPYVCTIGPENCDNISTKEYQVSARLPDGTYYAAASNQTTPDYSSCTSFANNGLVGHWKLDEAVNSADATDSSNNHNDGIYKNEATTTADAKFVRAGSFDGSDDYIDVSRVADDMDDRSGTISAWAKPNASGDAIANRYVFQAIGPGGSENRFYIQYHKSEFRVVRGTAGGSITLITLGASDLNKWYHLVMTWNSSGRMYGYLNGGLKEIKEYTSSMTGTMNDAKIGAQSSSGSNKITSFPGLIDDVRVYTKALTPSQVKALYDSDDGCIS